MKRLFKAVLRVIALALAIILAVTLLPYARNFLRQYLPQGKYDQTSARLTHEMQAVGELTAVRHRDTGVMVATVDALLVGTVQKVSVPYAYEIGLGLRLDDVKLTPTENGITVSVPDAAMLYDSFTVTGEPEVSDFWYRLTENRYQQMLDGQAAACRAEYLEDAVCMQQAWDAACDQLAALFSKWSGETLPLQFEHIAKAAD